MTQDLSTQVLFEEWPTDSGKRIGYACLNVPKALNALNLNMATMLLDQLSQWRQDEDIACVILEGSGEKAFCAGGDVVAMHNAMVEQPDTVPDLIEEFFSVEYRLDYLIHTFNKPFVVWGNGIVMGGGIGLMAGASHRVVTETSRFAMPEVTIGLYPDVGGSWFLNKMPGGSGLFLGLTGASVNAADALYIHLADHFVAQEQKAHLFDLIRQVKWGDTVSLNSQKLSDTISQVERDSKHLMPRGNIQANQKLIDEVTSHDSVGNVINAIMEIQSDDKWLSKAKKSVAHGSPLTTHLVYEQLKRGQSLTLAQCFQMELSMSCMCAASGEFREGVRALLIDKDNQPKWRFEDTLSVDKAYVETFFQSLWKEDQHPLQDLGQ